MEIIPILIFIVPSWLVIFGYYFGSLRPQLRSVELAHLNHNLQKVGLFWSMCNSDFEELSNDRVWLDHQRAVRHFWFVASFLSLMSLPGTLLLIAILGLGKSRLAHNIFKSRLTKDLDITPLEVRTIVEDIKAGIPR